MHCIVEILAGENFCKFGDFEFAEVLSANYL